MCGNQNKRKITKKDVMDFAHVMAKMRAEDNEGNLVLEFDASAESLGIYSSFGTDTTRTNTVTGWECVEIFRIPELDLLKLCQDHNVDEALSDDTRTTFIKAKLLTDLEIFYNPNMIENVYDKVKESREEWHQELQNREEIE